MKPGDRIKVFTKKQDYIGLLMPSLELTGEDTLILKLDNGYNIGIKKKDITKTKLISRYKLKKSTTSKYTANKKLPTVSILSTGGTISSKVDYRTGAVYADYTAKDFLEMMPELKSIANIKANKVMSLMSEDMLPKDWIAISKVIEKEIKKGVDGIVITQGTDTMHFTAAALSFMLHKINIPIVITGSQRSIDRGSSDSYMNLVCSVKAAALFDAAEVMVCMHGSIDDDHCLLIRGTKVRKMHTSRRDAFRPINHVPLAKVYNKKDFKILNKKYHKAHRKNRTKYELKASFSDKIALIYVYPGLEPDIIDFYLKKGVKGFVIAATALGHVNTWTEKSLIPYIKKSTSKKIPVFITTQTLYGSVNPYVYTNLRKVSIDAKGIYLKDILPETAYIKLGWVLSQEKEYDRVVEMMQKDYKGEFSSRLTPNMFLY
jgi:glutamyl-tRNA(Gln) amidotransferase subunit D